MEGKQSFMRPTDEEGSCRAIEVKSENAEEVSVKQPIPVTSSVSLTCASTPASCHGDAGNAVAISNRTKAGIASRRCDFFSDLMVLPATTLNSTTDISLPSVCTVFPAVSGKNHSAGIYHSSVSIPTISSDFPSTSLVVSSSSITFTSTSVNFPSVRADISTASLNVPLRSAASLPVHTSPMPCSLMTSLTSVSVPSAISNQEAVLSSQACYVCRHSDIQSNLVEIASDLETCHLRDVLIKHKSERNRAVSSPNSVLPPSSVKANGRILNSTQCLNPKISCEEPQSQQTLPPNESVQAPVYVIEPVCIEMTPCPDSSICLEPSPERIWGAQVSFLTFSCLDIRRTEVVGQMRQVSSTGCLESLGTQHNHDNDHHGNKLLASDGDFTSSVCSVSDSEKDCKTEKSPIEDNKSEPASKSFLEFDWGRVVLDSSIRSKKSGAGWSLGWHSPSARRKRGSAEKEPIPVTKVKETWRGRVVRTFKRYGSATVLSSNEHVMLRRNKGTFDIPIELCVLSPENDNLPLIVEHCTRIIEERGLENQGIYRVPGNNGSVRQMVEDLNEDPTGLCAESEKWFDVNVVSSLLKHFFRRLPDPLITNELYQSVIAASRVVDVDARLLKLRDVLRDLPTINFRTFHFLAQHLRHVAEHEQVNKMDARNLAIIFGPTLIRPHDNSMVAMVSDMNDQCHVIESVILHCDWFFGGFEDEVKAPKSEESKESTPVSSMSEELLARVQQLGDFDSPYSSAFGTVADKLGVGEISQRDKVKGGRDSGHSNDSGLVFDTPAIVTDDCQREVVFEIKRYPAYHFSDSSTFCTENAKPKVRRTHSSESLGKKTMATFSNPSSHTGSKSPQVPFNSSCSQLTKK